MWVKVALDDTYIYTYTCFIYICTFGNEKKKKKLYILKTKENHFVSIFRFVSHHHQIFFRSYFPQIDDAHLHDSTQMLRERGKVTMKILCRISFSVYING